MIGKKHEEERTLDSYNDTELLNLINSRFSPGLRLSRGVYSIYKYLNLIYPKLPEQRTVEKKRLKCFMNWSTSVGTIQITDIYDTPRLPDNPKPKSTKKRENFQIYKGYTDEEEFLQRVSQRLNIQQEYKGYSDICSILEVPVVKSENTKQQQSDWHRFFNWEVISQRKWVITEIYDIPKAVTDKSSRSVYANESSHLIVKRLYNDSPYLKNARLARTSDDDLSYDIMVKRDDMADIMGLNRQLLNSNEYRYSDTGQLQVVNRFVDRFNKELINKGITHTEADISLFKNQMSDKFRTAIEAGLNDLKNKGIIIRFFYTELYFDINTQSYGALFEKPRLDIEVSEYKMMVMGRFGITDWKYFSRLNDIKRAELMKELNLRLEEELGIRISYGYWIRYNTKRLENYYIDQNIESVNTIQTKQDLKDTLKERQQISAKKTADSVQKICEEENSNITSYSNNYVEVSSQLFESVFKKDENIKNLGHLYLTVNHM